MKTYLRALWKIIVNCYNVFVPLAEWLRRVPAKYMGFPRERRIIKIFMLPKHTARKAKSSATKGTANIQKDLVAILVLTIILNNSAFLTGGTGLVGLAFDTCFF